MDKGLTVPIWVLIVLPENTQNSPEFICSLCLPKFWISMKKRLHLASVVHESRYHFFKGGQEEAVKAVCQDMITLCNIVVKSLENHGIKCQTFHPHELGIIGTTSDFEIKQSNLDKLFENPENVSITHGDVVTGKSLSEVLILESTNPLYDYRLSMELPVQYMKTTSSEHVVYTNCLFFVSTFRTIYVHNMF